MTLKAVLLDIDNTLYDYETCNTYAMSVVVGKLAKKYSLSTGRVEELFHESRQNVKQRVAKTAAAHSRLLYFKELIEHIEGKLDPMFALELETCFWDAYLSKMAVYPAAVAFLSLCRARGLKIALISDLTTQIQLRKIISLGISDMVSVIITSEDSGVEKPHPAIFERALYLLGVDAKDAVMIGDDYDKDILGAEALSISTVHITDEHSWEIAESFIITHTSQN